MTNAKLIILLNVVCTFASVGIAKWIKGFSKGSTRFLTGLFVGEKYKISERYIVSNRGYKYARTFNMLMDFEKALTCISFYFIESVFDILLTLVKL